MKSAKKENGMTSEEKKLLNKMYDKEGHLTPLGKKVMAHGRNEITLNVSEVELNVLQVAILHMIELCSDETEQEQDETYGLDDRFAKDENGNTIVIAQVGDPKRKVWAERLTAAENLQRKLNNQIAISNGQWSPPKGEMKWNYRWKQ